MTAQSRAGFVTILVLLATVVWETGVRLDRPGPANREPGLIYLPKAEYLRPMSLGYTNVLADVLWFRAISYFGEHYRSDRTYPWLAHICDLVTDLDPKAEHVYRFAGVILPWEAEEVEEGIRLLEKGTQALPDSWILHYYLGFNYFFFRNDVERAIASLRTAARQPDVHPVVATLTAVLTADRYGPDTTLAFLSELEENVDSRELREVVRQQKAEVRLAADLEALNAAIAAYRERNAMPPPSLEELVDAGLIDAVPRDPFGGSYEIDPETGRARTISGREASLPHRGGIRKGRSSSGSVRGP